VVPLCLVPECFLRSDTLKAAGMSSTEESVWLRTRASLLARIKGQPDEAVWSEFYNMYWRAIYGYAVRFGMPHNDAADIVQEVFVKLFRRLPSFDYDRRKGRFLGWVKTITRTTVIDFFRRLNARVEGQNRVEPDARGVSPLDNMADPKAATDTDRWEAAWERSLLTLALERIRERVKAENFEAFRLYALENEPADEVATALGISRNTVFIAKSRILQMLKAEIEILRQETE
jgi:RNA polymerase sigma factor (sigma-70 family)